MGGVAGTAATAIPTPWHDLSRARNASHNGYIGEKLACWNSRAAHTADRPPGRPGAGEPRTPSSTEAGIRPWGWMSGFGTRSAWGYGLPDRLTAGSSPYPPAGSGRPDRTAI